MRKTPTERPEAYLVGAVRGLDDHLVLGAVEAVERLPAKQRLRTDLRRVAGHAVDK
jgi:hypothetical protein